MNFLRRCSAYLVPFSFLLLTAVGVVGWTLYPAKSGWFIAPAGFLFLLMIDVLNRGWARPEREDAFRQTRFALRLFITTTGLAVALGMLVFIAAGEELIDKSASLFARRTMGLSIALALFVFGNFLPKLPSPWLHSEEPFDWLGVHRFAGTAMMLAGVVMFAGWALMPIADARELTRATLIVMAVFIVGRKWYSLLTWTEKRRSVQP
jgi:hypothetical protein